MKQEQEYVIYEELLKGELPAYEDITGYESNYSVDIRPPTYEESIINEKYSVENEPPTYEKTLIHDDHYVKEKVMNKHIILDKGKKY